jgi:hypothetical protein
MGSPGATPRSRLTLAEGDCIDAIIQEALSAFKGIHGLPIGSDVGVLFDWLNGRFWSSGVSDRTSPSRAAADGGFTTPDRRLLSDPDVRPTIKEGRYLVDFCRSCQGKTAV